MLLHCIFELQSCCYSNNTSVCILFNQKCFCFSPPRKFFGLWAIVSFYITKFLCSQHTHPEVVYATVIDFRQNASIEVMESFAIACEYIIFCVLDIIIIDTIIIYSTPGMEYIVSMLTLNCRDC